MAVYVDSMRSNFGYMVMCHMIADTTEELLQMADKIGVQRRWLQAAGTYKEHFDICLSKRTLAIQHGAVQVSILETGRILAARKRVRMREEKC